jgi:hypothetical protein
MPDYYTVYMRRRASMALEEVTGTRRKAMDRFIDYLSENPFDEGDFSEEDEQGRKVFCKVVRDYAITYFPDHAVKELKVLEIVRTP